MRKLFAAAILLLFSLALQAQIVVNPAEEIGPIKRMNSVNNRPTSTDIMVLAGFIY